VRNLAVEARGGEAGPRLEAVAERRFVRPDDERASRSQPGEHRALDLSLERGIEVREDEVAAGDEVEGSLGELLAGVLEPEVDPRRKRSPRQCSSPESANARSLQDAGSSRRLDSG